MILIIPTTIVIIMIIIRVNLMFLITLLLITIISIVIILCLGTSMKAIHGLFINVNVYTFIFFEL